MEFKNPYEISNWGKKRGLVIPTKMTSELAEYLGIVVGDGYVGTINNRKTGKTSCVIEISGNMKNDLEYHEKHIIPLYKKLFNLDANVLKRTKDSTIKIVVYSKDIVGFINGLGIKSPKHHIEIPSCILNYKDFWTDFIRGLFDTDGSISLKRRYRNYHYYPVISLGQRSRRLVEQVVEILQELGFKMNFQYDKKVFDKRGFVSKGSRLFINGLENLELWMDVIGFNNPKNIRKAKRCFNVYGTRGI